VRLEDFHSQSPQPHVNTCLLLRKHHVNACLHRGAMSRDADATRRNLILAARRHFASAGYERATVRAIAADADVNPALINRYFGGKEQRFAEAVSIDLAFPDLREIPRDRIGEELVRHFFRRWEGDSNDDLLRALVRTAATNPEAAERLRA